MKIRACPRSLSQLSSRFAFFLALFVASGHALHAQTPTAPTPTAQTPTAQTPTAQTPTAQTSAALTPAPTRDESTALVAKISSIDPSAKTIELVTADGQKLHFDVTEATRVTKS